MNVPDHLGQIRALLRRSCHREAEALLDQVLRQDPQHPDLLVEKGMLQCRVQREEEALEVLPLCRGADRLQTLATILAEHFACRLRQAETQGSHDPKAAAALTRVQELVRPIAVQGDVSLAAILIVKNEEAHLERCLASVRSLADQIVVIDTGSTDRSVEIAKSFGADVGRFAWCEDFAAARNASLDMARTRWALWIDADEELTPESRDAVRDALVRPHFAGFFIEIVNFTADEGQASCYVHSPLRLFQRLPGIRFSGRIHEQILPSLSDHDLPTANLTGARLLHYGYRPSEMKAKGKLDRTLGMLRREVAETPDAPFHWFNLANAHLVARNFPEAVEAARTCCRLMPDGCTYGTVAFQILQTALIECGLPEESVEAFETCRSRGYATLLNEFEHAHALSRSGLLDEALRQVEQCFAMEWPEGATGDYGIVTHKRHLLRAQIRAQLGKLEESLEDLEHVLAVEPGNDAARYTRGSVHEALKRFDQALAEYGEVRESSPLTRAAQRATARVLLAMGRIHEAHELAKSLFEQQPEESLWAVWSQAAEALGDPAALITAYESAPVRDAAVLVNWGRALALAGDAEGALAKFSAAIECDPADANAYFNCGDLLYLAGQYPEAAEVYQAGLRRSPSHAPGWFVLGNALAQMQVWQGAKVAYQQAVTLDPGRTDALANLELVLEKLAA